MILAGGQADAGPALEAASRFTHRATGLVFALAKNVLLSQPGCMRLFPPIMVALARAVPKVVRVVNNLQIVTRKVAIACCGQSSSCS